MQEPLPERPVSTEMWKNIDAELRASLFDLVRATAEVQLAVADVEVALLQPKGRTARIEKLDLAVDRVYRRGDALIERLKDFHKKF